MAAAVPASALTTSSLTALGCAPSSPDPGSRLGYDRVVSGGRDALIEREAELVELAGVVAGVCSGAGATVVIEGPAGIGKTRLLEATRGVAAETGLGVLSARPGELERDLARTGHSCVAVELATSHG